MKIREIIDAIEAYAPLDLQEEWDNSGIQLGCADDDVKGVLLCTDVRDEILDEAIERGANLIVSHHPLIFHPLKKIAGRNYIERIVARAIKHDITIYAAHTNMDAALGGVNHKMASKLSLVDVEPLDTLGVVGNLPEPEPAIDFLRRVKDTFEVETMRYSGVIDGITVSRVAMCGGSGSFLKRKAIEAGAQVFITGDCKYHEFMGDERRIILADIGHWESEHFTKEIFLDIINKKNPTFAVDFARNEHNQLNYL
ncbi:MAG: Nif3-like dinuclear metal center hexameric protein [Muribaculaceae bacterium]|nr:Nif3-like dinuclear metal center hexameric protein [Muribaculaceae bacterium]